VIDVGGRDSATFRSALVTADTILIPLGPSAADVWATEDAFNLLDELAVSRDFEALAVFTRVVHHTRVAREAHAYVGEQLAERDVRLLETIIHNRVAWPQSLGEGLAVTEFEPRGPAARELAELAAELHLVATLEEATA
jgi:chromosome partitioning protein